MGVLRSIAKCTINEEIWTNPGVHLTCRRFEDEIELVVVRCFLCEEIKRGARAVQRIDDLR